MSFYFHPTAVIDEGCSIGDGTSIWHFSHLMKGCIIGSNCIIGMNVFIDRDVILGNGVKVQNNVSIYTGVICEDDAFLGPSCVFTNVLNPRSAYPRKDQFKNTIVRKGASIGANATIVCGNEIGAYAMVGAGAVVTRPVKAYEMVAGNPAKSLGWVSEHGHRLVFDSTEGKAVCPESRDQYRIESGQVIKIIALPSNS